MAMTVVEVKKWCGVQVVGHSKDVVQLYGYDSVGDGAGKNLRFF